jgi:hypothetical protein
LNRNKAVAIYKEILSLHASMGLCAFNFVSKDAEEYEIHFEMPTDDESKKQIENIVKKHNLIMKGKNGRTAIYKL